MHRLRKRKLKIWSQDYLVHAYLWPNIERTANRAMQRFAGAKPLVLDLGCGHRPYQDLFEGASYLGLDYGTNGSSPHVVGSAMQVPFADGSFDIVFCTQVIEHVPVPHMLVSEAARVLRPGGVLILTGPFYWPLHEEPFDFFRISKYGFEHMLKEAGFSSWDLQEDGGDFAQLFLSVCLRLHSRWLAPARVLLNCTGRMMDRLIPSTHSPANYTIFASK